ncbi:unnamed protein product [Phytophthora fragariaefolia]|uniref:Unnamed protein product n=1 Tax=Phytophthora fragariaefolia TaxID=1490495 RepID=A0A9W6U371_9STRA|nr:unnamed protein product [Phytophthora fragariaefolia]
MAHDIDLDLRDEAIAAADIDPEDEIAGSQLDGATEIVPAVTENSAATSRDGTPTTAALSAAAAAVADQQPSQDADTSSGVSTAAAPKRRSGRPRRNVPAVASDNQQAAAGVTDQRDAAEDRRDQRAPADESAADARPAKRRRTRDTVAVPADAIARRTRTQAQRDSQPNGDKNNSRDGVSDVSRAVAGAECRPSQAVRYQRHDVKAARRLVSQGTVRQRMRQQLDALVQNLS